MVEKKTSSGQLMKKRSCSVFNRFKSVPRRRQGALHCGSLMRPQRPQMLGVTVPNFQCVHKTVQHHPKHMPRLFLLLYLYWSLKWWADDGLRITRSSSSHQACSSATLNFPPHIFGEEHNYITYYLHTSKHLFQAFTGWQGALNF